MSRHTLIDWQHLDQPRFDRIVEALLVRIHQGEPGAVVEVLDGRGGDGGIDVAVLIDGLIDTIYQLKYFPDGFSGDHRRRRQQIKRSFEAAQSQRPRRWVLVTPGNLTPGEKDFVRSLRRQGSVEVGSMGRAALDEQLAQNPDLLAAFTRDPLVATLREIGQEAAALTSPGDLEAVLADLRQRVSGRSAYWDFTFEVGPEGIAKRLYAKHPRAAELEPITINLTMSPDRLDADARHRLDSFFDFGSDGGSPVVLPPESLVLFEVEGPEWIAERSTGGQVEFRAASLPETPVDLRAISQEGRIVASHSGTVQGGGTGKKGFSVAVRLAGNLTMDFKFPTSASDAGELNIRHELVGADALEANRAIRFHDALVGSDSLQMWLDGKRAAALAVGGYTNGSGPSEANRLLADDLATIALALDASLHIPEHLSAGERAEIRSLRLILDGQCVLVPEIGGLTMTLNGEFDDTIRELLTKESVGIRVDSPLRYEFKGHAFDLPRVTIFHPNCRAANGAAALAALESGSGAGLEVIIESLDNTPFRAFLPDKITEPNTRLAPEALKVPGLNEHPALAKIREHAGVAASDTAPGHSQ